MDTKALCSYKKCLKGNVAFIIKQIFTKHMNKEHRSVKLVQIVKSAYIRKENAKLEEEEKSFVNVL